MIKFEQKILNLKLQKVNVQSTNFTDYVSKVYLPRIYFSILSRMFAAKNINNLKCMSTVD